MTVCGSPTLENNTVANIVGILILTSNRVGTFDQAFKSRIQLALHYENLKRPQRRKIWWNSFTRLRDLGEIGVDY